MYNLIPTFERFYDGLYNFELVGLVCIECTFMAYHNEVYTVI